MDYKATDFPFTIMDVASLLRLNIRRRGSGHIYVDCPICGDRRGKMNLNINYDTLTILYVSPKVKQIRWTLKFHRICSSACSCICFLVAGIDDRVLGIIRVAFKVIDIFGTSPTDFTAMVPIAHIKVSKRIG